MAAADMQIERCICVSMVAFFRVKMLQVILMAVVGVVKLKIMVRNTVSENVPRMK